MHSARPRHVAIIMDGNGRWATAQKLPRIEGHRRGADSVRDVVRAARQMGLEALTLYAFSSQNWARPPEEVKSLMELLRDYLVGERDEIMENGIRLVAIGNIGRLPEFVRQPLDEVCGQKRYVLPPFPQRRDSNLDQVQPVVEIVAEAALAHFLLQVLVCGRNHARVHPDFLVPAYTVEAAFLQHPQQIRLQLG